MNTCQYRFQTGPKLGDICGEHINSSLQFCDRCTAIKDLMEKLEREGEPQGQCQHNDPFNGDPCGRPMAFRGYCLMCLSVI